jgi:hypothetical protein
MALVDKLTQEYMESTAPDPSQATLGAMLGNVTLVRVIDGGMVGDKPMGTAVLLEVSDPSSIASLRDTLAIIEDPDTFGHCMCLGNPTLQLYAGQDVVATIGMHHGVAVRWSAWKHDAHLRDGRGLREWLADRGVLGPRKEYEDAERRAAESVRFASAWVDGMPPCLRPYWENMQGFEVDLAPMRQALQDAYATQAERILALFAWFGSGAGPWSGYPMYEGVTEDLLFDYPTSALVSALSTRTLTQAELEGGARFFAGWDFSQKRRQDRSLLSSRLRNQLLEHALTSKIQDNIDRANKRLRD